MNGAGRSGKVRVEATFLCSSSHALIQAVTGYARIQSSSSEDPERRPGIVVGGAARSPVVFGVWMEARADISLVTVFSALSSRQCRRLYRHLRSQYISEFHLDILHA